MNKLKLFTLILLLQIVSVASVQAGEFAWLDSLTAQARADAEGFRLRLATRFHIGDAKISAVIRDVGGHAKAYMVLRLAEMSHQPVETVIKKYHANKGKGWGVLAKRLGIKPGSKEFHALKRDHDLYDDKHRKTKGESHGKNKDKGKGKNKDHGKGQGNGQGKGKNK